MVWFWPLPLTVDLVSLGLCARQDVVLAGRGVGGLALAQARTLQLDAMGAVNNAVQYRIPERGIPDYVVSAGRRDLAGDQQRTLPVTSIYDLQQIPPLLWAQRLRPPVVQDEQPSALQRCH